MEQTVKERLIAYLKNKKIGQNRFEALAGLSNGYISHLVNAPGLDKLTKILNAAPDLNKTWLLAGEGEMLNSNTDSSVVQVGANTSDCEDAEVIESFPMLPEEVAVNPNTDIEEYIEENSSELEKVNPSHKLAPANAAERILRTSMMPTFQPEDIVFVRFLPDRMKICDGDIYYLNCKNRPTMIRRIKFESDNRLRLIAQNPQYGDVVISREDIINVGTIVGLLRMTFGDQYAEIEAVRREKDEQIGNMLNMQRELISEIREQGKRQDKLIDKIIG
ncbi:MAG: S24 family peptidase [Bacteroidaceae bacterium]|nr:S24 family peptidase [Bacteroidaceae bacterium]